MLLLECGVVIELRLKALPTDSPVMCPAVMQDGPVKPASSHVSAHLSSLYFHERSLVVICHFVGKESGICKVEQGLEMWLWREAELRQRVIAVTLT